MVPVPKIAERGDSVWDTGLCDAYAVALVKVFPTLKLGACGIRDDYGWHPQHYFAHDDEWLYDVTGARRLADVLGSDDVESDTGHDLSSFLETWGLENGGEDDVAKAVTLIRSAQPHSPDNTKG